MSHGSGAGPFDGESTTPPTAAFQQDNTDLRQEAHVGQYVKTVPICTKQSLTDSVNQILINQSNL